MVPAIAVFTSIPYGADIWKSDVLWQPQELFLYVNLYSVKEFTLGLVEVLSFSFRIKFLGSSQLLYKGSHLVNNNFIQVWDWLSCCWNKKLLVTFSEGQLQKTAAGNLKNKVPALAKMVHARSKCKPLRMSTTWVGSCTLLARCPVIKPFNTHLVLE